MTIRLLFLLLKSILTRLLEEMANTVYESHTNEHILVKFLADLHAILDDRTVWGNHLGSETLIRRHKNTRFKKI